MLQPLRQLTTLGLFAIVVFIGYSLVAQAPESRDNEIAVIDVARVFKSYQRFRDQVGELREGSTTVDQEFAEKRESLQTMVFALKELVAGTPEHADLQQRITTDQAKLQADIERARARLVKKEADLYAKTYEHMQTVIGKYSREQGISVVIRSQTGSLDSDNPKQVLEGVNRFVVFEDRVDITDNIIGLMSR